MEISDLTREERETHISMVAADRDYWDVYSDDPTMIRKLDEIAEDVTDTKPPTVGKYYRLESNQVRLFRRLTPEKKEKMAANLRQDG